MLLKSRATDDIVFTFRNGFILRKQKKKKWLWFSLEVMKPKIKSKQTSKQANEVCVSKCLFIYFVVLDKSGSSGEKRMESGVFITPNKILINGSMVMSGGFKFMLGIAIICYGQECSMTKPTFASTHTAVRTWIKSERTRGLTVQMQMFNWIIRCFCAIISAGVGWLHSHTAFTIAFYTIIIFMLEVKLTTLL